MPHPPELIAGRALTLRRAVPADGHALFLAANNREVMHFMDWPAPTSDVETTAHLRAVEKSWAEGSEYQWVILTGENDELAGTISCRPKAFAADFPSVQRESAIAVLEAAKTRLFADASAS